MTKNQ